MPIRPNDQSERPHRERAHDDQPTPANHECEAVELALSNLRERIGIRRTQRGLVYRAADGDQHLIERFSVLGTAVAIDGCVLGAILAAGKGEAHRKCIAPLAAIREPKMLAQYFERIGIVPPSELQSLKLIAKYVDTLARCKRRTVLTSEGIHAVKENGEQLVVAAINGSVLGTSRKSFVAINPNRSVYRSKGSLEGWKELVGPLLRDNPMLVVGVCFALSAPLGALLGFNLIGLLIAGPSSIGKTTLGRLVLSTFQEPGEPHQWASTANGIEALALQYRDLPLVLDELGSGDVRKVLEVIYRNSGGVTKARASAAGDLLPTSNICSPIFATGEISLHQQANAGSRTLRAGHDARMPTIWVNERHGIYSDIGDALDGAVFARRVSKAIAEQYGVLMPAFVKTMTENRTAVSTAAAAMRKSVEKEVAGEDVHQMSAVERRVLAGFANFAVAGELAVAHELLPLQSHESTAAAATLFRGWLAGWREQSRDPLNAPLRTLRDFFKRKANSRFVPFQNWEDGGRDGFAGYIKQSQKYGTHYLVFREFFEKELAKEHGLEATVNALRAAKLLISGKRGRTLLVRMPGRPAEGEDRRMAFYAISDRIRFDGED